MKAEPCPSRCHCCKESARTCRGEGVADVPVALAVRAAAGGRAVAPLVARSRRPAACSTQPRLRCNRAGLQAVVVLLLPPLPPPGHSELWDREREQKLSTGSPAPTRSPSGESPTFNRQTPNSGNTQWVGLHQSNTLTYKLPPAFTLAQRKQW